MTARSVLLRATVLAVLTAGTASGCASAAEGDADPAVLAARLAAGFAAQTEVEGLTDRLSRSCMEARGFRTHPVSPAESGAVMRPYQSTNVEVVMEARQIVNEERAAEIGYGVAPYELLGFDPAGAKAPPRSAFDRLPRADRDRYWTALLGYVPTADQGTTAEAGFTVDETPVRLPGYEQFTLDDGTVVSYPREGCLAETQQRLFDGRLREFTELGHYAREGIAKTAIGELRTDPVVRAGNGRWAACMQRRGHDGLGEPFDARNQASSSYGAEISGPSSPGFAAKKKAEIALALADYACNHEVRLDETRVGIFWRNVARFYAEREAQVAAWQDMLAAARTRAQQLLGR